MKTLPSPLQSIPLMLPGILLLCCSSPGTNSAPVKHVVEIKQMLFQPQEVVANPGDTVEWVNHDLVDHDVTEQPNKEWSSSKLSPGQSWKFVVKNSADYYCSIHQVMKGKISVR